MKLDRRQLLAGSAALALMPRKAEAWFPHGGGSIPIGHGWNTLPLGAGGLVTGFNIAPDGTMVARTDVGNVYRWSGTTANITDPSQKWVPLLTFDSLGGTGIKGGASLGGYEIVIAPNTTLNLYGIFCDFGTSPSTTAYYVYYSTDAGLTWTKSALSMLNADSAGSYPGRVADGKIAVDPNNANVVYCGMPDASGNTFGVYRATDGVTFSGVTGIATPTIAPGTCGIVFDTNYSPATTVVGGQTRTTRIIIPVGGVGIYESTDGGVTFTEVFTATLGNATFAVAHGYLDYDGTYYCQMNYNNGNGYIWRYSHVTGSWAWLQLDAQSGWPLAPGQNGNQGILIVDPRSGHQGSVSSSGLNGLGAGFTSTNANIATGSSITWGGFTGGYTPSLTAPSYDVGWLNLGVLATNAYLQSCAVMIDQSGVCWWCGAQGFWHTTAIPNYALGTTSSVCTARGMEQTVSQDVLCPPGATYPTMGVQDIGVLQGTFVKYPTTSYDATHRADCESLSYAASDPSFMVAKVDAESQLPGPGNSLSGYSNNYGVGGSWTPYANMPDLMYEGAVTAGISNGSGSSGSILNVTAVASGNVVIGQAVYAGSTLKGTIISLGTGSGGTGTYNLDTSSLTTSQSMSLTFATESGVIVAVDHDHHVCVPSGYNGSFQPVYTVNATSTCTWNFCSGLPVGKWTARAFRYGPPVKPFAVGYGADLGIVWGALWDGSTTITVYKSTDSGATWASVSTVTISVSTTGIFLCTVPGYPGELWLTGQSTGGYNTALNHSKNWGATWTTVATPAVYDLTTLFILSAPSSPGGYPTLYGKFSEGGLGSDVPCRLFKGTYNISTGAVVWALFGPTGTTADLPKSCQLQGIQSLGSDWNVYQRLYVGGGQSGFAYYNP